VQGSGQIATTKKLTPTSFLGRTEWYLLEVGGAGRHVLVTEFRGMTLNSLYSGFPHLLESPGFFS